MGKKVISFLLVISLIFSTFTSVFAQNYSDMPPENYWSYKALNEAVNNGLIKGYDNKINPKSNITRAQIATILNRAFGAVETADIRQYKDVDEGAWYAVEMAKAVKMGSFSGSESKLMSLSDATRQEVFTVLARALKLKASDKTVLDKFADSKKIPSWAADATAALVENGYLNGSGGKLNPLDKITLEEFAQIMSNIINMYISVPGTYTDVSTGNVMINTTDVVLKNLTVDGDLIIGEGAKNSDITLDGVTVKGRLIARGGGENSIKLINKSNVGSIVVTKTASGAIRVKTEEGCQVEVVYIEDNSDDVILEGVFNQVEVAAHTPVVLNDATVTVLAVKAEEASVKIEGKSVVAVTDVSETAKSATLEVGKDAVVQKVTSKAEEVVISGEGKVVEAQISGNNTKVNTANTELTVSKGTEGVTENGKEVAGNGDKITTGSTPVTPKPPVTEPDDPTPPVTSSVVKTSDEFVKALQNSSVKSIDIASSFNFEEHLDGDFIKVTKPVTVSSGVTLTILSGLNIQNKFTNNGTVKNNGVLELHGNISFTNSGMLVNDGDINYYDILGVISDNICSPIKNVTGNGTISNYAVMLNQKAVDTAFAKKENGQRYYTDFIFEYNESIAGFDGTFTLPAEEINITAGHDFNIYEKAKVVVPSGCTLTLESETAGSRNIEAFMLVAGVLEIKTGGSVVNNGFYTRTSTGSIIGTITAGTGDYQLGYTVSNQTEWTNAVADPKCYAIVVNGDIAVSTNTEIKSNFYINQGKTLTINQGINFDLYTRYDGVKFAAYNEIRGILVNNGNFAVHEQLCVASTGELVNKGEIRIEDRAGLYMEYVDNSHYGKINNSAGKIYVLNGWADIENENGYKTGFTPNPNHVVETYASLTDIAREILYKENPERNNTGILTQATAQDVQSYEAKYADWSDFGEDNEAIMGVSNLLKNGIISPVVSSDGKYLLNPYDTLTRKDIAVILHKFILKAIELKGFEHINTGEDVVFSDISGLSNEQKAAASYLAKAGIIAGNHEGKFLPDGLLSTVWKNPDGTPIDGGSSMSILTQRVFDKLAVVKVLTEQELRAAMENSAIRAVKITDNIELNSSLTIKKDVTVELGKTLTVKNGNLTVDKREESGNYGEENYIYGYYGKLIVEGTLDVLSSQALYNYTEIIADGGTIKNSGTYADINGDKNNPDTKRGYLRVENDGILENRGIISINNNFEIISSGLKHLGGIFTNNGTLLITGGLLEVKAEFHNAEYMKIEDIYNGQEDGICDISGVDKSKFTDNSNWIEYTARAYSEQDLKEAVAVHNAKLAASENNQEKTMLDVYNRLDICGTFSISDPITFDRLEAWIVDYKVNDEVVNSVITNTSTITLKDSIFHITDKMINNGTVIVGIAKQPNEKEYNGNLQIWPTGELNNTGTMTVNCGEVFRMDNLVSSGGVAEVEKQGKITGYSGITDIAIVHNFAELKKADKDGIGVDYERIDVMRYEQEIDSDIVITEDITIDENMYIEPGCGMEVADGKVLSFTGSKIDNCGDIQVFGILNLDADCQLNNEWKIQIGGALTPSAPRAKLVNNGVIENKNYMEIFGDGLLTNNNLIENHKLIEVKAGGEIDGTGYISQYSGSEVKGSYHNVVFVAKTAEELESLLNNAEVNTIMVKGEIKIENEISINKYIIVAGDLKFIHDNTLFDVTVTSDGWLDIQDGRVIIGKNATLINNGEVSVKEKGNLKIDQGGKLNTSTVIDVLGNLDLWNWDNTDYITGYDNIITYYDRGMFAEIVMFYAENSPYKYDESAVGNEISVTSSSAITANVATPSAIMTEYDAVDNWFDIAEEGSENIIRRYAYAAMIANEIKITSVDDLNKDADHPHKKLDYAYVRKVFYDIATKIFQTDSSVVNTMLDTLIASYTNDEAKYVKRRTVDGDSIVDTMDKFSKDFYTNLFDLLNN